MQKNSLEFLFKTLFLQQFNKQYIYNERFSK